MLLIVITHNANFCRQNNSNIYVQASGILLLLTPALASADEQSCYYTVKAVKVAKRASKQRSDPNNPRHTLASGS